MKISVIVPVYNGEKYIDIFWKSIESQSLDPRYYEILIVDNKSTDESLERLKEIEQRCNSINIRVLEYRKKASSYGARNMAVKEAAGEILAFTDIDCIPHKDWLKEIEKKLSGRKDLIIGGRVELIVEDGKSIWENFDKQVYLSNERYTADNKAATANMATRRETFHKTGAFLEVVSGEDHQWSMRAAEQGIAIEYAEDAVVYHPTRKTHGETRDKMYRVGYGRGQRSRSSCKKGYLIHALRILHLPRSIALAANMTECSGRDRIEFILRMFSLRYYQLRGYTEGRKK